MAPLLLGILLLIVGTVGARNNPQIYRLRTLLMLGGTVLTLFGVSTKVVKQIDAGEIAVQLLFGKVQEQVLYEGLNVVNPLITIETYSKQTQNYTMGAINAQEGGKDILRVLSADGLEVSIDLTVLYRLIPEQAPELRRTIGADYESKVIRPVVRTRIREKAVEHNAVELFSSKRDQFQADLQAIIEKDFNARGFILENLLVRKIALPQSVKESIERKITAIQEAQRMEFVLQKEKQQAEIKRVEARGVADAQRILNEGLSAKVLQYETIKMQKELANSPNSKIIIMGNSKNSPPLFLNSK